MRFLGLHHVQLTVPSEAVPQAHELYVGRLGLREIPKPESLTSKGGFWVLVGTQELHISPEDGVDRTLTKAHPAFEVDDLEAVREVLVGAGLTPLESIPIPGLERFECRDPFGNRLEFLRRL